MNTQTVKSIPVEPPTKPLEPVSPKGNPMPKVEAKVAEKAPEAVETTV